jgi:hypothetical protein
MYVRQALDVLEGLIPVGEDAKTLNTKVLEKLIVFSIMWSLGALLELDDRKKVLYWRVLKRYYSIGMLKLYAEEIFCRAV